MSAASPLAASERAEAWRADGIMGEKTKLAVEAFQSDNGLHPTGQIDEALVNALLARK